MPRQQSVIVGHKYSVMKTWASHQVRRTWISWKKYSHTVIFLWLIVVRWNSLLIQSLGTGIAVGFHELPGPQNRTHKGYTWTPSNERMNWPSKNHHSNSNMTKQSIPPPAHPPSSPAWWIWPGWTGCDGCQSRSDTQTHPACRMPSLDLRCAEEVGLLNYKCSSFVSAFLSTSPL